MTSTTRLQRNFRGVATKFRMEALEPRVLLSANGGDSIYVLSKPNLAVAGSNIGDSGQSFVVDIIKSDGSVDTSYNGEVSISVSQWLSNQQVQGGLTGTLSVNANNGVATFSDLTFTKSGDFNAQFTDVNGDPQTNVTEIYNVSPAGTPPVNLPSQLRFIEQPTVASDGTFSLTVAVEDAYGNPVNNGNTEFSLLIFSGPAGGVLSSITGANPSMFVNPPVVGLNSPLPASLPTLVTALADSNGIATFSGLGVSVAGSYTLEIEVASPMSQTLSASFVAPALPVVLPQGPVMLEPPLTPIITPVMINPVPQGNDAPSKATSGSHVAAPIATGSAPISPVFALVVNPASSQSVLGAALNILGASGSSPGNLLKNL